MRLMCCLVDSLWWTCALGSSPGPQRWCRRAGPPGWAGCLPSFSCGEVNRDTERQRGEESVLTLCRAQTAAQRGEKKLFDCKEELWVSTGGWKRGPHTDLGPALQPEANVLPRGHWKVPGPTWTPARKCAQQAGWHFSLEFIPNKPTQKETLWFRIQTAFMSSIRSWCSWQVAWSERGLWVSVSLSRHPDVHWQWP